ncbi:MAG: energy transducer TonB [Sphingomonadales bacterium]|nr:energy transducer TonB [Sphingomonadales bacterium]
MKKTLPYLGLALLCLSASPAAARDWGTVSGWYVTGGENSCGLYSSDRGGQGTEIVILKRLDGNIYIQANNLNWALGSGWEGTARVDIDGENYSGAMNVASLAAYPGRGLLAVFGGDFEAVLRRGRMLGVRVNGFKIADISLDGSSAALAVAQSCLDELRSSGSSSISGSASVTGTAAALPSAGFETLSAAVPQAAIEAKPKNGPSGWITISDYPRSALRDRREGTAAFRLSIGSDGRIDNCEITQSSGHSDLDEATCKAIQRRARFEPARTASGLETSGRYESKVTWKVPG